METTTCKHDDVEDEAKLWCKEKTEFIYKCRTCGDLIHGIRRSKCECQPDARELPVRTSIYNAGWEFLDMGEDDVDEPRKLDDVDIPSKEGNSRSYQMRLCVPGGWLFKDVYRAFVYDSEMDADILGRGNALSQVSSNNQLVFIPDPLHTWGKYVRSP